MTSTGKKIPAWILSRHLDLSNSGSSNGSRVDDSADDGSSMGGAVGFLVGGFVFDVFSFLDPFFFFGFNLRSTSSLLTTAIDFNFNSNGDNETIAASLLTRGSVIAAALSLSSALESLHRQNQSVLVWRVTITNLRYGWSRCLCDVMWFLLLFLVVSYYY